MTKRNRILAALAVVSLAAGTAWAWTYQYSSGENGLSATATSAYTAFTDNHTGGNSGTFGAMEVFVKSRGAGVCFVNPGELVAVKGVDIRIASGESFVLTYNTARNRNGWAGIAYVCATGATATLDVVAWR